MFNPTLCLKVWSRQLSRVTVVHNSDAVTYVHHTSVCACPLAVSYLLSLSGMWRNKESHTKAILSNSGNRKRSRNVPKEWKVFSKSISLTNKHCLKIGSCEGFLHTKHSFLLSPTPNTWLPAPFLIKPINRWWHDTRSVIEKQKNMSSLCKRSSTPARELELLFLLRLSVSAWMSILCFYDCSFEVPSV